MKENIYFPVYQKIEKEVIDLASSIYFSDGQTNVYSLHIADLIIRCSIELESIVKDIYRENNGKEPKKPFVNIGAKRDSSGIWSDDYHSTLQ